MQGQTHMSNPISVPISYGELFDKISILEIKAERLTDMAKLENVNDELRLLKEVVHRMVMDDALQVDAIFRKLKGVNQMIWEVEDKIRDFERRKAFDSEFIEAARSIYRLNDQRASIKRELNVMTSSQIVEEKSYSEY